jgi:hypothetical protein
MTETTENSPLTAAELDAIRRRNRDLASIPFEPHNGIMHGDNCPPCNLVRGIGDVSKLLEQLDRLSTPETSPFAMQRPEYEVENQRLWDCVAEADLARVQAELRVAQLRLVLGSALRSFTKERRRHSMLRSRWVQAAKVERWRRVYEETERVAEPEQSGQEP